MAQEEMRKGLWTEQEDLQLAFYVNLFGDRRWDFLAKISGLRRTGKSCRLRWVNYLHPDLKRGKMTPQEECLILELHSKWGNRWSRIAREVPGRTDNEIKNYWRTHVRKKAQVERKKRASIISPSSSFSNSSSFYSNCPDVNFMPISENKERNTMDDIWNDIELSEENETMSKAIMPSPIWDYCPNTLWMTDEEETKTFPKFYYLDNQDNNIFG